MSDERAVSMDAKGPQGEPTTVRMDSAGRIVIPAEMRAELGLKAGDRLMLRVTEPGYLEGWTTDWGVRFAQAIVRRHVPEGVSLVDELLADRRAEFAKEEAKVKDDWQQRVLRERHDK